MKHYGFQSVRKQLLHTDRQWPSQTLHVPLQSCSTRNIHLVQTGPLHLESYVPPPMHQILFCAPSLNPMSLGVLFFSSTKREYCSTPTPPCCFLGCLQGSNATGEVQRCFETKKSCTVVKDANNYQH